MKYKKLGNSGLEVSSICFGGWAIGGDSYGPVRDEESIEAIHEALDQGINFFDTAPIYGKGHSETIVGKAMKGKKRDEVIIATKFGLVWDGEGKVSQDISPKNIRREIEDSLRRLETDYIDLYQVHWPVQDYPFEDTAITLDQLKREGKIRYVGVSNFSIEQMEAFSKGTEIHSLQPPYHLLSRDIEEEILPYCLNKGIGVIPYGSMGHGLFSGTLKADSNFRDKDMRIRNDLFQGDNYIRNLAIVEKLKEIAARTGHTPGQLAVSWVLHHPAISSAIVGATNKDQVKENAKAADWELSQNVLGQIEQAFTGVQTYKSYHLG
jgi:aryl-alcohol dehydrogenase-like predicted oxidoreductase